jgi:ribosomal protein S18 acetylase RimI-like enzyme
MRKAIFDDIQQIKLLMEKTFGPFSETEKLFSNWIADKNSSVCCAFDGKKLIGVCTWKIKENTDYSKYSCFGSKAIEFMKSRRSVWVLNLAVDTQYRKSGVGTSLSLAQINWLKNTDAEIVLGSSWVSGSDDNSAHLYSKAGFEKLGESDEFLRSQMQNGAECAVCKSPDCACKSLFFGITTLNLLKAVQTF